MMFSSSASLLTLLVAATLAVAAPTTIEERAACNSYVLISTRGSGEAQGPTGSFKTMVATTLASVTGGATYNTVYPASWDQNSASGTADIINQISTRLASCPNQKFALLGYSQGAAATVDALKKISTTSASGLAIKAVVLAGNPQHKAGLASNVDQDGGSTTKNANGISASASGAGLPSTWDKSGKVIDICYYGDGVCSGNTINLPHTYYQSDSGVQTLGSNFMVARLK